MTLVPSGQVVSNSYLDSNPAYRVKAKASTDGEIQHVILDVSGEVTAANPLPVSPLGALPSTYFYAVSSSDIVDTTPATLKTAAGVGIRYYVTAIAVSNMNDTNATRVDIKDGAVICWSGPAAINGGGFTVSFPIPLRLQTNVAISAVCGTSGAAVRVAIAGFTSTD